MTQVLITGASRGIGAEMTRQMRARGDTVTATSRDGSAGLALDVTDPGSLQTAAASLTAPLDLLICNAGVFLDRPEQLETGYPPELWAQTMATNVAGVFACAQTFLPALRESTSPRIAIIASRMGSSELAWGGAYIYRASKAAAINLGRNLAVDLKSENIAVGIYHPGWVQTDMGGAAADIDAATSATGLIANFDRLGMATTGEFLNFDGQTLPF